MLPLAVICSSLSFLALIQLPLFWEEPWMREPLFPRRDT